MLFSVFYNANGTTDVRVWRPRRERTITYQHVSTSSMRRLNRAIDDLVGARRAVVRPWRSGHPGYDAEVA